MTIGYTGLQRIFIILNGKIRYNPMKRKNCHKGTKTLSEIVALFKKSSCLCVFVAKNIEENCHETDYSNRLFQ